MKTAIRSTLVFLCLFCVALWSNVGALRAQTVTGQISGTAVDPSGAVIAGAKVALTYTLGNQTRETVSGASGDFIFTDLIPGTYNLSITATGFQSYQQSNITVTPTERVALHEIQLAVGATTTEITVQANAAHVETDSSEHSSQIDSQQFTGVPDRGRNFLDYLALVPGTTTLTQTDAPGGGNIGFNGGENQTVIQLDGIESQDIGAPGAAGFLAPNIDSIQTVKVLTGAVPAEYGVRANGSVTVVVKNGTRDFHGSAYEFNRNDDYNANTYFNKLNHVARQPYKYNNPGFTIGGPVLLPGVAFNKNRDRLFFFFTGDFLSRKVPSANGPSNFVVPTLAERNGNFSLTNASAVSGGAIVCPGGGVPTSTNPLTCGTAQPNTAGIAMLKLMPNPTCNRPGVAGDATANGALPICTGNTSANLVVAPFIASQPRHDYILRTDFNITKNNLLYVRLIKDYSGNDGGNFLGGNGWGQLLTNYDIRSEGAVVTLVSTLRPNLVNELVVGEDLAWQKITPHSQTQFANNVRTNAGLGSLPTIYPAAQHNPLNLLPNASFGGGSFVTGGAGVAGLSEDSRFPFYSDTRSYNVTDNISWVLGRHNMKFGFYYENSPRGEVVNNVTYNGAFNFSVSPGNPLDTGYTYSNAYFGVFQSYLEFSAKPYAMIQLKADEWFAQDNWKATRKLTIDYGVRFYHIPDPISRNNAPFGYLDPSIYSASAQPTYIVPCATKTAGGGGCTAGNLNQSPNPFPASAVGLYVPNTGTPYQGMVIASNTRNQLRQNAPIGVGPRLGFAWDVFGNGKTALRGGFGVFYDQLNDSSAMSNFDFLPPPVQTQSVFNSTITALANPQNALLGPPSIDFVTQKTDQLPVSYEYQLGVQRDLGHNTLIDVSYVGNVARHGIRVGGPGFFGTGDSVNAVPYGADFGPNAAFKGTPNLMRTAFPGYGQIGSDTFSINSNYNSLQAQVTKRVGRLSAGGSYTYAKVLDDGVIRTFNVGVPLHRWYGPSGNDRRHNLAINWQYALTGAYGNKGLLMREAVAGWNVQGLASFVSGAPGTIGASYGNFDINGASASGNNGGPVTLNIVGNPVLSGGQRVRPSATQAPQYLNIAAVAVAPGGPGVCTPTSGPASCGLGNQSLRASFYGPGINNWDISLFKNFPLGKIETRQFQLRLETYNTFNHTQFSGVSSTVQATGGVIQPVTGSNANFGQFTGTQAARILVIAGKLYF